MISTISRQSNIAFIKQFRKKSHKNNEKKSQKKFAKKSPEPARLDKFYCTAIEHAKQIYSLGNSTNKFAKLSAFYCLINAITAFPSCLLQQKRPDVSDDGDVAEGKRSAKDKKRLLLSVKIPRNGSFIHI